MTSFPHLSISLLTSLSLTLCSAGVGRTGVFILLELALYAIQSGQDVDIGSLLSSLRSQRMYLVQTEVCLCVLLSSIYSCCLYSSWFSFFMHQVYSFLLYLASFIFSLSCTISVFLSLFSSLSSLAPSTIYTYTNTYTCAQPQYAFVEAALKELSHQGPPFKIYP